MQKLFNLNINNNNNNNYNNKSFIHLQASTVVQPVLQYGGLYYMYLKMIVAALGPEEFSFPVRRTILYYIYVPEDDCGCTGTRRI